MSIQNPELHIVKLMQSDRDAAYQVFEISIPDAFAREGLGSFQEDIAQEIKGKKQIADAVLDQPEADFLFLVAKIGEKVVGTISFGAPSEAIVKYSDACLDGLGELQTLYILPDYQGRGMGSMLITALINALDQQGIKSFCLDSGYKNAQKRWLRKFGQPYKVVKDYWGPGSDNFIWLCKVADYTR